MDYDEDLSDIAPENKWHLIHTQKDPFTGRVNLVRAKDIPGRGVLVQAITHHESDAGITVVESVDERYWPGILLYEEQGEAGFVSRYSLIQLPKD